MVNKADTLKGGSYVGPATFARSVSLAYGTPEKVASSETRAAASPADVPMPAAASAQARAEGAAAEFEDADSTAAGSQPGSTRSTAPKGRLLNDAQRRRLEAQEATALKMQVAQENIKDAIITAQWPVQVRCCSTLQSSCAGLQLVLRDIFMCPHRRSVKCYAMVTSSL